MFTNEFEKTALSATSTAGKAADKFSGMVKKHWGQIREGIAEGFKKGVWDPRKAMTTLAPISSSGQKVKDVAKNTTQVAKQYGPSVAGAAALGRASKGDSSNQTANMNYMGGGY